MLTCQTQEVGFFADLSLLGDDSFAAPEDTASEDKVLAWLTDGVETDQIGRALSNIGIDPCPVLLAELQRAQLQSGRFATIPWIDSPVRSVKQRGAGHFDIFTDNGIVAGDRVLLRLLPPPSNP